MCELTTPHTLWVRTFTQVVLSPKLYNMLVSCIAAFMSSHMIKIVKRRRFNQLGALQV